MAIKVFEQFLFSIKSEYDIGLTSYEGKQVTNEKEVHIGTVSKYNPFKWEANNVEEKVTAGEFEHTASILMNTVANNSFTALSQLERITSDISRIESRVQNVQVNNNTFLIQNNTYQTNNNCIVGNLMINSPVTIYT
ncbi:hypothetical protein [Piscirickettsia litoralis]|uniref:Uncharacterized protein n=1 Tax=Piscirickettsia litoralis TaxID=1891921 RepID=A0ABX3A1C3_9GAMM|nr:hypothetical protein [Piscirickettsia litoralis]ODN42243.1 hypothetical protein BGC07_03945 [Piscirickettsia litoralis]